MRDPILQEKRQEHVSFQKYALELLERLSGKTKHTNTDIDASLVNIHRANVVAQTRIHFNDKQLLQLIHQHLVTKGLNETADTLLKEAHLSNALTNVTSLPPSKFRYTSPSTPSRTRLSFSGAPVHRNSNVNVNQTGETSTNTLNGVASSSIKLIK